MLELSANPLQVDDKEASLASKDTLKTKARSKGRKEDVDQQLIRALGHPLRTRALAILNERVASPNELAKEMDEGLSQVSYHIKVLKECEFIELVSTEQRRGAVEHYYRGVRRPLLPDDAVAQLPQAIQTSIAGKILAEIVDDTTAALTDGSFDAREERHLSWTPVVVDEEGWQALAALLAETLEQVFDIETESSGRLVEAGEQGVSATVALAGFESSRSSRRGRSGGGGDKK